MNVDDDFRFEPIPGLPEVPPEGETILWQGRPSVWALAKGAFKIHWIAIYFAVLAGWRILVSSASVPLTEAMLHAVPLGILGLICIGVLWALAFAQARAAMYTLTTHRVALRVGAALQMTLNLPYTWIENANLTVNRNGTGTIALQLRGETRLSYLMTWPHVRPWRMAKTEPALRCIPEAGKVAQILADAAEARVSDAASIRVSAQHAPTTSAETGAPEVPANALPAE